jgi:hypothetical protein
MDVGATEKERWGQYMKGEWVPQTSDLVGH